MTGIEELRERVLQAERRFGVIDERDAKYSGRLITLMNAIEGRIREQQAEIEQQSEEILRQNKQIAGLSARLTRVGEENDQLRAMLHSLLKAIEGGQRDSLAETMLNLDRTVCALMQGSAQAAELDAAPLEPEEETAVAEIGAEEGIGAEEAVGSHEEISATEEPGDDSAQDEVPRDDEGAPAAPHFFAAEDAASATQGDSTEIVPTETVAEAEEAAAAGATAGAESEIEFSAAEEAAEETAGEEVAVAETLPETAVADEAAAGESSQPCTLDEIMRRVSRLVEEADAAGLPEAPDDTTLDDTKWDNAAPDDADDAASETDADDAAGRAAAAS